MDADTLIKVLKAGNVDQEIIDKVREALSEEPEEPEDKGVPKRDGSGRGIRANFNRGGCYDILKESMLDGYRRTRSGL